MTAYLINEQDIAGLNNFMLFLGELPQYVESFKIIFELVSSAEYGTYKEPALDRVMQSAVASAKLWTVNLKPLRHIHTELNEFINIFQWFSEKINEYVLETDTQTKKSSISDSEVAAVVMSLAQEFNVPSATSVMDIIRYFDVNVIRLQTAFDEKAAITSSLGESVFDIIPRVLDFMNLMIDSPPAVKTPIISLEDRIITAKARAFLTHQYYERFSSAAANFTTFFDWISQLLLETRTELAKLSETSTLSSLKLSLKLTGVNLSEVQSLSTRMTTMLQTNI